MLVYVITNNVNGKQYVGQTIQTLKQRWQHHGWKSTTSTGRHPIALAMRKYGKAKFSIIQLEQCFTQKQLDEQETFWAHKLNTFSPNGYNLKTGNGPGSCSPEVGKKISLALKGRKISGAWKKRLSQSHKGLPVPAITLAALQANRPAKGTQLSDKAKYNAKHRITYTITDPEGVEVVVSNLKEFCTIGEYSYRQFHKLTTGKLMVYKGWRLKSRELTRFL